MKNFKGSFFRKIKDHNIIIKQGFKNANLLDMNQSFKILLLTLLVIISNFACSSKNEKQINLNSLFTKYEVKGSFLLYDESNEKYYVYNKPRASERLCPASSFKVFGTLAILDSGIIKDEKEIIPWDGSKYFIESFNQDQSLEEAFHYSTEWVYQRLIKQIGRSKMQEYLNASNYGNKVIGEEIDKFWLDESFKVSSYEQINFLRKLDQNKLPFNELSINKTKEIMIQEQTQDFTLRGKTGTRDNGDQQMSWFIGYLEQNSQQQKPKKYFFATNVFSKSPDNFFDGKAVQTRIPLTEEILKSRFNLMK